MNKKILIVFICLFTGLTTVKAQEEARIAISQAMQAIYKNYDSVPFLSFDVKFDYGSDTLLGKYNAEQMDGSYTLAGKKARYRLGDVDFMQNDSFFIAVYNKDKLIVVDEPKTTNIGNQLPMRQQIDSLLLAYADHYTFSTYSIGNDTGVIQLLRADEEAQFNRFSLTYDNRSKMIYEISYDYPEAAELDTAVIAYLRSAPGKENDPVPQQKKRFTIRFLNYRFDNYDEAIYDENNYIWFENGMCKPAAKYDDYKIYYTKPTTVFYEEQQ